MQVHLLSLPSRFLSRAADRRVTNHTMGRIARGWALVLVVAVMVGQLWSGTESFKYGPEGTAEWATVRQ